MNRAYGLCERANRNLGCDYQPFTADRHRIVMRLRLIPLVSITVILFVAIACNSKPSPEQIRQKTAEDTATLKQDTKAVAEGIKDGLTEKKLVDVNKASKQDLQSLPGIDARRADRIIAERPYTDKYQLVDRGALSADEYAKIQDLITVAH
jgi:competence protein ComEA